MPAATSRPVVTLRYTVLSTNGQAWAGTDQTSDASLTRRCRYRATIGRSQSAPAPWPTRRFFRRKTPKSTNPTSGEFRCGREGAQGLVFTCQESAKSPKDRSECPWVLWYNVSVSGLDMYCNSPCNSCLLFSGPYSIVSEGCKSYCKLETPYSTKTTISPSFFGTSNPRIKLFKRSLVTLNSGSPSPALPSLSFCCHLVSRFSIRLHNVSSVARKKTKIAG